MKTRNWVMAAVFALGAAGAAGVAVASKGGDGDGERRVIKHRVHGHASVEFAAMHNIMAELLSAKTGKTPAEIAALFDAEGPHGAADKLGIKHEDMKPLMQQARATLIDRALKANLITSVQAEKLKAAKIEMRHKRRSHDDGEDDDD